MPPRTRTVPPVADPRSRRRRERRAALPCGSPRGAPADRPLSPLAPDPPRPTRTTGRPAKGRRRHPPTQADDQRPGPARAHHPRPPDVCLPTWRVIVQHVFVIQRTWNPFGTPSSLPRAISAADGAGLKGLNRSIGSRIRGLPLIPQVRSVSANRTTAEVDHLSCRAVVATGRTASPAPVGPARPPGSPGSSQSAASTSTRCCRSRSAVAGSSSRSASISRTTPDASRRSSRRLNLRLADPGRASVPGVARHTAAAWHAGAMLNAHARRCA